MFYISCDMIRWSLHFMSLNLRKSTEDFGSEQVEHPIQIWWVDVANAWEPYPTQTGSSENHRLKLVPLKREDMWSFPGVYTSEVADLELEVGFLRGVFFEKLSKFSLENLDWTSSVQQKYHSQWISGCFFCEIWGGESVPLGMHSME